MLILAMMIHAQGKMYMNNKDRHLTMMILSSCEPTPSAPSWPSSVAFDAIPEAICEAGFDFHFTMQLAPMSLPFSAAKT